MFTHLTETESFRYLSEAKRVLRTNGTIVVSYLDPNIPLHARIIGKSWTYPMWWMQRLARLLRRGMLNRLLSKTVLDKWAKTLDLSVEHHDEAIGQSVCVYRRK